MHISPSHINPKPDQVIEERAQINNLIKPIQFDWNQLRENVEKVVNPIASILSAK